MGFPVGFERPLLLSLSLSSPFWLLLLRWPPVASGDREEEEEELDGEERERKLISHVRIMAEASSSMPAINLEGQNMRTQKCLRS